MNTKTKLAQATLCDTLLPLLEAMLADFQEAAKKKPDGVLSEKKVEIANRMLEKAKTVLEGEDSNDYVDTLDTDNLPQNGDAALILGQAFAAIKAFHNKYFIYDSYERKNVWRTEE